LTRASNPTAASAKNALYRIAPTLISVGVTPVVVFPAMVDDVPVLGGPVVVVEPLPAVVGAVVVLWPLLHAPSRVKPAAVTTSTRLIEPTDAPWQIADLSNHGKIAAVLPVLVRSRRADRLASDRDEFSERLVRLRGHRRPS
jgi:hypothetical protein